MHKKVLLALLFSVSAALLFAQQRNQTKAAIDGVKNLFAKKRKDSDSSAFIANPSLGNLAGHWKGKYTLDKTDIQFEYHLYLYKTSATTYEGFAESRGRPITYGMYTGGDPGTSMRAIVSVKVKDTTKYDVITISEDRYMTERQYQFRPWPLKVFTSELIPRKKDAKMTGYSDNILNYYYNLTLNKVSDEVEEADAMVLKSIKKATLEITQLTFQSDKKENFLGYMESGYVHFLIKNTGASITPVLGLSMAIMDENGAIIGTDVINILEATGLGRQGIEAGRTQGVRIKLQAVDRVVGSKIKMEVSLTPEKEPANPIISQTITIDVKQ